MNSTRNRSTGFTLIEMIVATAIGVMLVSGVYSATQSMTRAARTQAEVAKRDAPLRRAEEIIRNDLRGWIENGVTNTGATGEETALLSFSTTTDALLPENGSAARSSVNVRYVVRPVLGEFELLRVDGSVALPLMRTKIRPTVEFYDSEIWAKVWTRKDRPFGI
jgi:prepilin-type N-terminal cleavage/methylation domain-containing protein